MIFDITCKIEGFITQSIEAENEQEAIAKALKQMDYYPDYDIRQAVDFSFSKAEQAEKPRALSAREEMILQSIQEG